MAKLNTKRAPKDYSPEEKEKWKMILESAEEMFKKFSEADYLLVYNLVQIEILIDKTYKFLQDNNTSYKSVGRNGEQNKAYPEAALYATYTNNHRQLLNELNMTSKTLKTAPSASKDDAEMSDIEADMMGYERIE